MMKHNKILTQQQSKKTANCSHGDDAMNINYVNGMLFSIELTLTTIKWWLDKGDRMVTLATVLYL